MSDTEEAVEITPDAACGVPLVMFNTIREALPTTELKKNMSRIMEMLRIYEKRVLHLQSRLRNAQANLLKSKAPALVQTDTEAGLKRLRLRLAAIDRSDDTDEVKMTKKMRAAVECVDPEAFHLAMTRALSGGDTAALRLVAQMTGLLQEEAKNTGVTFNFNAFEMSPERIAELTHRIEEGQKNLRIAK